MSRRLDVYKKWRKEMRIKELDDLKKQEERDLADIKAKEARSRIPTITPEIISADAEPKRSEFVHLSKHPLTRAKNQYEMRRLLQACTTEGEVLAMKKALLSKAVNPKDKDCVKAIALLWAYVLGKPEQDVRIEHAQIERTAEEKQAMLLAVLRNDEIMKSDTFRNQLAKMLTGNPDAEFDYEKKQEAAKSGDGGTPEKDM